MTGFKVKLFLFFLICCLLVNMFPVSADTFGNQDGGTNNELVIHNKMAATLFSVGSSGGNLTGISAYTYVPGPTTFKCAIYDSSRNLLSNGITNVDAGPSGQWTWVEFGFNNSDTHFIKAGHDYYLAIIAASSNEKVGYNLTGGNGVVYDNYNWVAGDYGGMPDPFTIDGTTDADGRLHIYANFNDVTSPPTNINGVLTNNVLNISWNNHSSADTTMVRVKEGSYPSSSTDGTLVQNNTLQWVQDDLEFNTYYSLFTYNSSTETFSSPGYLNFTGLKMQVYNESNVAEELTFDVLFSNQSGTEVSDNDSCSSPTYFDMDFIPTGENIQLYINSTNYTSRTIVVDLNASVWTNLTVFLSSNNNLYYIQVFNEFDQSIYEVDVEINRFLNGSYQNVEKGLTDGYGYIPVYMTAGETYKVNLSKTGYTAKTMQTLIPDDTYYGIQYPIVYHLDFEQTTYKNETAFHEEVIFTLESSGTTLYSNYTDGLTNTTDTSLVIYEIDSITNTVTEFAWYNTTDTDTWSITNTSNASNCYKAVLFLNHTNFNFQVLERIACGDSMTYRDITDDDTFNNLFDINYGYNPFGWANTFGFFIMLACLFSFGQLFSGVSVMFTGFFLLFINVIIGLTLAAVLVPTIFILLSLLILWDSHRKVA